MSVAVITPEKFYRYRTQFKKNLDKVPARCVITFTTQTSSGSFTDFTGDSNRTTNTFTLPCLYNFELSEQQRLKYGMDSNESGIIFLSPIHLQEMTGYTDLTRKDIAMILLNEGEFAVNRVKHKEPLYNSCIAIQLYVMDRHNV